MTDETLADLMREIGLVSPIREAAMNARPRRPMPRQMRSAFVRSGDANPGVRRQGLADLGRESRLREQAFEDADTRGAYAAPRNQFAEAGQFAMEATGAPSLARGIRHVGAGEPDDAIPELLWGALGVADIAGIAGGVGGPARGARGALQRPQLPPRTPWQEHLRAQNYDIERPMYRGLGRGYESQTHDRARFATSDPDFAGHFARHYAGEEGANIMPVYPRRGRELVVESDDYFSIPAGRVRDRAVRDRAVVNRNEVSGDLEQTRGKLSAEDIAYAAQRLGYDSVRFRGRRGESVAVFREDDLASRFGQPPNATAQQGPARPPPRPPGRATDGSVLPVRPPQPIRQSLVGGSDDLTEAARMRPDGGSARVEQSSGPSLADLVDDGMLAPGLGPGGLVLGALRRARVNVSRLEADGVFDQPMPQRSVEINQIRRTDHTPPEQQWVDQYAQNPGDPIIVRQNNRGGFDVIDGHHRLAAAQARGDAAIDVYDASLYFPPVRGSRPTTQSPDGGGVRAGRVPVYRGGDAATSPDGPRGGWWDENPEVGNFYAHGERPVVYRGEVDPTGYQTQDMAGYDWWSDNGARLNQVIREAEARGAPGVKFTNLADADNNTPRTQYFTIDRSTMGLSPNGQNTGPPQRPPPRTPPQRPNR